MHRPKLSYASKGDLRVLRALSLSPWLVAAIVGGALGLIPAAASGVRTSVLALGVVLGAVCVSTSLVAIRSGAPGGKRFGLLLAAVVGAVLGGSCLSVLWLVRSAQFASVAAALSAVAAVVIAVLLRENLSWQGW